MSSVVVQTQMSAVGMIGSGVAVAVSAIGALLLVCSYGIICYCFVITTGHTVILIG